MLCFSYTIASGIFPFVSHMALGDGILRTTEILRFDFPKPELTSQRNFLLTCFKLASSIDFLIFYIAEVKEKNVSFSVNEGKTW